MAAGICVGLATSNGWWGAATDFILAALGAEIRTALKNMFNDDNPTPLSD